MRTIAVFIAPHNYRSGLVGRAMATGIARELRGDPRTKVVLKYSNVHKTRPEYDSVLFYGLAGGCAKVLADYRDHGRKAFYIDLGYWVRRRRSRWDGYHKIALNSRHPTAYFQRIPKKPERYQGLGLPPIQPWRKSGKHVLVLGMSGKAAAAEGFAPHQWETETISALRQLTDRPIIYRPKPNWEEAKPIPGAQFGGRIAALEHHLSNCHAVVTHHSNAAIDALLAGVPCISPDGAASVLSGHKLEEIENPPMPDGRHQFAYDLAWTQWTTDEMMTGHAYRYLVDEGLLP